jgi:hypothetical protein
MKKILIFGAILIIAILAIVLVINNKPKISTSENIEFDKHIFTQAELDIGQKNKVSAAPAPITPNCKTKGIITDVKFVEARNNTCVDFNICVAQQNNLSFDSSNCCQEDHSPSASAYYVLFVYVQELESIDNADKENYQATCEDSIKTGSSQVFFIYNIDETPKSQSEIEGTVENAYMRIFSSYNIK